MLQDRLVERRPALLIRHLEKKQKRELLDIVAVRQPVVAQDVAVVPEFLNELRGLFGHVGAMFVRARTRENLCR